MHRDVDGLRHVALLELIVSAHIQYGDIVPLDFGGQGGEVRHPVGTQRRLSRESSDRPHSHHPHIVDADAHEFPLGSGDLR